MAAIQIGRKITHLWSYTAEIAHAGMAMDGIAVVVYPLAARHNACHEELIYNQLTCTLHP